MLDKIQELKNQGFSPAKIAAALNAQGLKTSRGKAWADHSVNYQLSNGSKKSVGAKVAKTTTKKVAAAAQPPARKAALRKVKPSSFTGGNVSIGRRIDLAKEILGAQDLDPSMRVQIAATILNG